MVHINQVGSVLRDALVGLDVGDNLIIIIQRFGTESIGKSFGVFMLLWFLLLGVTGAFSITSYPLILKAFNP